jgi:two-component system KDP operon response regulator KdpE
LRRARSQGHRSRMVWFGAGTIDLDARVVRAANHDVSLTPTEFGILEHLVSHANHTVPSDELVKMLWGADPQRGVHSLRLFIRKLRQKLEPDPTRPQFLVTEPTVGYRLKVPVEALAPNPSEKPR